MTSQRESTPGGPKPGEAAPKSPGEKPGDAQKPRASDGNGDPQNPLASKNEPRNSPSGPPPGSATGRTNVDRDTDRWGDLPVQAREVFRAQGGDALPLRYRDFIDTYYRRLNEGR